MGLGRNSIGLGSIHVGILLIPKLWINSHIIQLMKLSMAILWPGKIMIMDSSLSILDMCLLKISPSLIMDLQVSLYGVLIIHIRKLVGLWIVLLLGYRILIENGLYYYNFLLLFI